MNILQMEDLVKGMPDEMLMQEAQMPSGQIPQFLALSEVQRRKEMRDKFQAPPQATVADQILQSGIASAMPQQPPQGGMAPPQGPPMGAPPVMAYGGGMMPYTMYGGGQVPYRMQEGRTVPGDNPAIRALNARIASAIMPRRAQFTVIREAKALRDQGKIDEAVNLLTQEGIDPRQVLGDMPAAPAPAAAPAAPAPAAAPPAGPTDMLAFPMRPIGLTPDFSAMDAPSSAPGVTPPAGGAMLAAPRQDAASMISEIAGALPDATRALSGMNAGIPDATRLLRGAEPVQADYEALRPDFSPFIQQVEQRGKESVQRYEQSIKDIEDRMKKERLGAVLTTLGANLMAGESAVGLEKAGALAQQMGKEARQEIAAERRALDAAREGTADKMLTLQLQQVTADTGAKRDFLKANDEFRKLGVQVAIDQGKEARAAQRDMNQLALNLASNTISRLKSLDEQNALNTRSFVTAMSAESDTVLKLLEQMMITDPNEKIKKYNQLMESKIRGYGALYPNIDISSVIAAFKQDTGGTGGTGAQSGRPKYDISVVNPGR